MNVESEGFDALFQRESSRVRGWLALRRALAGLSVGLVGGSALASVAWYMREGSLRPLAAALGAVVGVGVGLYVARRRRLSDQNVALYLDARLASDETITTAFGLVVDAARDCGIRGSRPDDDEVRVAVVERARAFLVDADPKRVRPRVLSRVHALIPLGAAAIVALSLLPLPPAPPPPVPPPGTDLVVLADVPELERIEELATMPARDEAQRQRLADLADQAKKLREKLRNGAPRREVQADLAKLSDSLLAERLSLGEGEERKGLESALAKLAEQPALEKAKKALGDRDLVEFDEEMQRLANSLEKDSRDRAKQSLEDAAEAAKKEGATDVAKMLEEQKKLLEERAKKAETLRDVEKGLGEGLPEETKRELDAMRSSGDPEVQKKVAKKLAEAIDGLDAEQQKKLAENLKKQIEEAKKNAEKEGTPPPDTKALEELAKQLDTEEGRKALKEQLEKMANEPPKQGAEAERQQKIEQAEQALDDAAQKLGNPPGKGPPPGSGSSQANKPGQKDPGKSPGQPPGTGVGGQKDPNKGPGPGTPKVDAKTFKSHAPGDLNAGTPNPGMAIGRSPARAGETANLGGTGALGAAGPDEVNGVARSDVPEEYRDQVGRYFQP